MNKVLEKKLLKRLRKQGLHCEGVGFIAVLQFPIGSVGLFDIYGTPQDEMDELKALLATDEFITLELIQSEYVPVIWLEDITPIVKAHQ